MTKNIETINKTIGASIANELVKDTIFVLKDNDDNYVGNYSIRFDEDAKKVIYAYSKYLCNGFFYNSTWEGAKVNLDRLQSLEDRFKLGKQFRIEEIDHYATLSEESKTGKIKVGLSSIQCEYTDFDDNQNWIWVIKNSNSNYVHRKSVKILDSKTYMYISYKTFGPECRGWSDQLKAEHWMDVLKLKSKEVGLEEVFYLEYINLNDAIKLHKAFNGENMVVTEMVVA